ncbi:PE-PPE domain-containing protein [Mycolicibacterium vaccae]|uniref:PE-PPE domain-containing protein n=1 Tax=Mycolicibacterium vaccae TaxID=1810 RepID=UPI003D05610B
MRLHLGKGARAVACQVGAMAVAASSTLLMSPAAQAARPEVVLPGPATVLSLGLVTGSVHDDLKGAVCAAPNSCRPVTYPRFYYPSGADPLNAAINATDGLKVVYGYSQGGQVISAWMRKYANSAGAPAADELVFVIVGNGDRPRGGSNAASGFATPATQYKVIDIARQYDFAADFPDNPWNLLALANAMAGFSSVHTDYENVDLNDPDNIVWTEGNTTYVFVPTKNLPLLNPLRALGLHDLANRLNGPLKEIVERGYNRDYLPAPDAAPDLDEAPPVLDRGLLTAAATGSEKRKARPAVTPATPAPEVSEPPVGQDDPGAALTDDAAAEPATRRAASRDAADLAEVVDLGEALEAEAAVEAEVAEAATEAEAARSTDESAEAGDREVSRAARTDRRSADRASDTRPSRDTRGSSDD